MTKSEGLRNVSKNLSILTASVWGLEQRIITVVVVVVNFNSEK